MYHSNCDKPRPIEVLCSKRARDVACGSLMFEMCFSLGVCISVVCTSNCEKPRLIEALRSKRVRDIACGSSHSAAIISSGELFTWGLGDYGRLGHGDNATQLRPKQVQPPQHRYYFVLDILFYFRLHLY